MLLNNFKYWGGSTHIVQCVYSVCTMYMYIVWTMWEQYVYSVCTMFVQFVCTMYTHCIVLPFSQFYLFHSFTFFISSSCTTSKHYIVYYSHSLVNRMECVESRGVYMCAVCFIYDVENLSHYHDAVFADISLYQIQEIKK